MLTQEQFTQRFDCTVVAWNDGEDAPFAVFHNGALVVADSLELLLEAVDNVVPMRWAA